MGRKEYNEVGCKVQQYNKALKENGRKIDEVYPVDTGTRDSNSCRF
jgi:hypothetical protein